MSRGLSSERLTLSIFDAEDITAEYIGWLNDPIVLRFSNQRFRQHDRTSCEAYLHSFERSENLFYSIRLAGSGRLIGTMTAYRISHHGTGDMGLLIGDRAHWGRGLGLEAWSLLMQHLFNDHSLRKITGGAVAANAGMISIMQRSGMHHEATKVEQEIIEGRPQDVMYFAKFNEA